MPLPNFIIKNSYVDVKTHQSVYSDGVNVWTTNGGGSSFSSQLHKYNADMSVLLTSNTTAVSGISGLPSSVHQINGMDLKDGKLYIGLMNYPTGSDWPTGAGHNTGNQYAYSWIARYDADTLAYEKRWEVGDSTVVGANSVAKWTEGCAFGPNGNLFVCFHGDPVIEEYSLDENGDLVFEKRHTLTGDYPDNSNSTFNARGYEDITFAGNHCIMNRHVGTNDPFLDMWRFDGTDDGFVHVGRWDRIDTNFTQGMNIQPGTNLLWCCERTNSTTGTVSEYGDVSVVRVVGFDLAERSTGVFKSAVDTGVVETGSSGIINSK